MVETFGFIVSLLSLLYLFTRQNKGVQKKDHQDTTLDERELDDSFKLFLKSLENDEVARGRDVPIRLPPPSPKKKEHNKKNHPPSLERGGLINAIDRGTLKVGNERRVKSSSKSDQEFSKLSHPFAGVLGGDSNETPGLSGIESAVHRLKRRRDLLIYQEIMGKPKSLRADIFPQ